MPSVVRDKELAMVLRDSLEEIRYLARLLCL